MQWIDLLLLVKIVATALIIPVPYLFFSDARVAAINGEPPKDRPLMRLYAVAILALLVAYASALSWLRAEGFPWGIVTMGIVSNGGATAFLLFDRHTALERSTALLFGSITLALLAAAAFPDIATSRVG
ncbi:MAG: hypothetical protein AAGA34_14950 [Pseudomonadota bacterium]